VATNRFSAQDMRLMGRSAKTWPVTAHHLPDRLAWRSAASLLCGLLSKDEDPRPGLQTPSPALGGGLPHRRALTRLLHVRSTSSPWRAVRGTDAALKAQVLADAGGGHEEEGQEAHASTPAFPTKSAADAAPLAFWRASVLIGLAVDPLETTASPTMLDPSEAARGWPSSQLGRLFTSGGRLVVISLHRITVASWPTPYTKLDRPRRGGPAFPRLNAFLANKWYSTTSNDEFSSRASRKLRSPKGLEVDAQGGDGVVNPHRLLTLGSGEGLKLLETRPRPFYATDRSSEA